MSTNQTMVKMVSDRWYALVKMGDTFLNSVSEETLQKEIAPGKNRGIYLLGHLIAVHDEMILLLNFGEKLYPELYEPFLKSPDKTVKEIPSAKDLRAFWNKQNEVLAQKIESLQTEEWFGRHSAVSDEDFIKEPHRNKLNILLTRSSHLSYHIGQLILIK
jgi:hypothetical protein